MQTYSRFGAKKDTKANSGFFAANNDLHVKTLSSVYRIIYEYATGINKGVTLNERKTRLHKLIKMLQIINQTCKAKIA